MRRSWMWLILSILLSACASYNVVPASLESQLDRTLTFSQLKESPNSYKGRLVVLGGETLAAKRLKQGTRIEVLQLPLERSLEPGTDRTASQGRFLVLQREFLDPATIPPGTRITVVGEVIGEMTLPLDETEYLYPLLEVKTIKVWPQPLVRFYPPPSMTYPYWSLSPYRGPWHRYGQWW
ncbi:MAG: Slp family lipoprotein [Nitrospirae bacterium]|nr:Slp family lipoprotein [Nitrospirota bacterium]